MATNFSEIFKNFARIIDHLESKVLSPDNISNWITQIVGNGEFSHAIELTINKTEIVAFDANFMPASSKGNSTSYLESARIGNFGEDNLEDNCLLLLAYCAGWMCLGKPLAAVNIGRGLVIRQLLSDLKISDMTIQIKDVSFGGDQPKRDIGINWTELLAYVEFQCIRSNRIELLANRSGKVHHANSASKPKMTRTVKKI
jgi:hypothetical protein